IRLLVPDRLPGSQGVGVRILHRAVRITFQGGQVLIHAAVIPALVSGILPWLIPPACGALVGAAVGYFALGRIAFSLLLRNRPAVSRAVTGGVEALTGWVLALRVGDLAADRTSSAAVWLEGAIAETLGSVLRSRAAIYAVRDSVSRMVGGLAGRRVSEVSKAVDFPTFLSGH